jgi:hypothetical protein
LNVYIVSSQSEAVELSEKLGVEVSDLAHAIVVVRTTEQEAALKSMMSDAASPTAGSRRLQFHDLRSAWK